MSKMHRAQAGFTLLELLVVIIIIGILAGVALPRFIKATERARQSEALQQIGGCRSAEHRYFADHSLFTATWGDLDYDDPMTLPARERYFDYSISIPPVLGDGGFECVATRQPARTPPPPTVPAAYQVALDESGDINKSAGAP